MSVRLMAHIPNQLVVGCLVYIVQGNGKLYYPQTGSKMATMHTYHINDKLPQFLANLKKLVAGNFFEVIRVIDLLQQWAGRNVHETGFKL